LATVHGINGQISHPFAAVRSSHNGLNWRGLARDSTPPPFTKSPTLIGWVFFCLERQNWRGSISWPLEHIPPEAIVPGHQRFKEQFLAGARKEGFVIEDVEIAAWLIIFAAGEAVRSERRQS